jgi:hypothetical protein
MKPVTILSLASLAQGAIGMGQSAIANREIDKYISGMNRGVESWYNSEKGKTYLDSPGGQSALAILSRRLKKRNEGINNEIAKGGASNEKVVAAKSDGIDTFSNFISSLAEYDQKRKEGLKGQYLARKDRVNNMTLNNLGRKSDNWSNFSNNAGNTLSSILYADNAGAFDKWEDMFKNLSKKKIPTKKLYAGSNEYFG